jgi:pilus assembly protein CpaC
MTPRRGSAPTIVALFVYIIVILVAAPQAQQPPTSFTGSPGAMTAGPAATVSDATSVDLLVGRSTILNLGTTISRVSLTVPDIADALVTAPQQLLIHGKTPGTISLFVWDRAGGIKTYEVNVRRDLKQLVEQVQQLFPGEPISVAGSGKDVVLSGTVSSKYVIDKAADVATGYVEKKENVVNLLKQQEGVASNQVMLRVRFAEVSRSALQELGASFVLNGYKSQWYGRTTTQQFPAPAWDQTGKLVFSDFLNLFVLNTRQGLGGVIRALQEKGLFQSLAEPNLIALNGKEASFLAGGEYPYPVVQPGSGGNSVTITFKEFGVRLHFTPTVLGNDLVNLKVSPEVSSLDFSNAITIQGFRVPALSTRRTDTEVELQDGQTFAIAGLMNNTMNNSIQKIPGIGDIPILGLLFKSRAYQKNQTELVVMITPTIVRRGSTGVSQGLPSIVEPYLGPPEHPIAQPAPYVGSPRYPSKGQPKTTTEATPTPASQPRSTTPANAGRPPAAAPAQTPPSVPPTPQNMGAMPAPQAVPPATPAVKPIDQNSLDADRRQLEAAQRYKAEQDRKKAEGAKVTDKKADKKSAEQKAAADKKAADEKAAADKKAGEAKARQQKIDEERAKREAIVAKKNAEDDRKKQEDQKKREKSLTEAAERLREAQAAYQAEVDKAKGSSNDKPKGGVQ